MRAWALALPLAMLAASGAARPAAPAEDELAVIVAAEGAPDKVSRAQLEAIFTSGRKSWDDGRAVVPLNLPPDHPLRHRFDEAVLRMTPDEVSRFWIDARVRDGARPPRQVIDPQLALRLVAKVPGAIGYVPARLADANVRVVARVRDGKVIDP